MLKDVSVAECHDRREFTALVRLTPLGRGVHPVTLPASALKPVGFEIFCAVLICRTGPRTEIELVGSALARALVNPLRLSITNRPEAYMWTGLSARNVR